ncbi:hypothetical protein [Nocardia sp. NPDC058705]|uniref:hypothetical protein n=1 Tax=Nocardia sp. NPDC058705 TaxID=3346609 RepID=UPI0036950D88
MTEHLPASPSRQSQSSSDAMAAFLALLVLTVGTTMFMFLHVLGTAAFETSNNTCGAHYGGCHTPSVAVAQWIFYGGSFAILVLTPVFIALGAYRWRIPVLPFPLLALVLIFVTFLVADHIAGFA